ncbi:MAG: hypothetical protein ACLFU1_01750 [Alphaproteobacteria bacterium]
MTFIKAVDSDEAAEALLARVTDEDIQEVSADLRAFLADNVGQDLDSDALAALGGLVEQAAHVVHGVDCVDIDDSLAAALDSIYDTMDVISAMSSQAKAVVDSGFYARAEPEAPDYLGQPVPEPL